MNDPAASGQRDAGLSINAQWIYGFSGLMYPLPLRGMKTRERISQAKRTFALLRSRLFHPRCGMDLKNTIICLV